MSGNRKQNIAARNREWLSLRRILPNLTKKPGEYQEPPRSVVTPINQMAFCPPKGELEE